MEGGDQHTVSSRSSCLLHWSCTVKVERSIFRAKGKLMVCTSLASFLKTNTSQLGLGGLPRGGDVKYFSSER